METNTDLELISERPCGPRNHSLASRLEIASHEILQLNTASVYRLEPSIDLTGDTDGRFTSSSVHEGEASISRAQILNVAIFRGDFVQVQNVEVDQLHIDFVEINDLTQDKNGICRIRGTPYVRTKRLSPRLRPKSNEVCAIHHYYHGRSDHAKNHMLVEVCPSSFVQKRQLIKTNAGYPLHNSAVVRNSGEAILVCRWKYEAFFLATSRTRKPEEEALVRINYQEVTNSDYHIAPAALSLHWRGESYPGGSWNPTQTRPTIDLNNQETSFPSNIRGVNQKYTMLDSFSGAGGVSRGAQTAGWKVSYAVDKEPQV